MAEEVNKRDLVVTRVKEAVDSGVFKPGQVVLSKDIIARCPEVWAPACGVTITRMAQAGLLKALGSKRFEITEDIAILSLNECLTQVITGSNKRTYTKRTTAAPVEPEEALSQVNLLDSMSQLRDDELPDFVAYCLERLPDNSCAGVAEFCLKRLSARAFGFANDQERFAADLLKLEQDNDRLRQELKVEKERTMELRTEVGKARGGAQLDRLAGRKVTIETKPIPPGGTSGGSGPHRPGDIIVHRKSLMGHTPKVVRDHIVDPKK